MLNNGHKRKSIVKFLDGSNKNVTGVSHLDKRYSRIEGELCSWRFKYGLQLLGKYAIG